MDFDEVCKYVGKLFLEKENLVAQARKTVEELTHQLGTATRERDEAIRLLNVKPGA